jgi:cell division protein FtsW (lipid II flippase)
MKKSEAGRVNLPQLHSGHDQQSNLAGRAQIKPKTFLKAQAFWLGLFFILFVWIFSRDDSSFRFSLMKRIVGRM